MSAESADDIASMLDPDDFGVEAVYAVSGGASATLRGIFDNPQFQSAFENADAADNRPTFFCRSADLPIGATDAGLDTLTIGAVTRKISLHEPDGQGMVLLRLAANA